MFAYQQTTKPFLFLRTHLKYLKNPCICLKLWLILIGINQWIDLWETQFNHWGLPGNWVYEYMCVSVPWKSGALKGIPPLDKHEICYIALEIPLHPRLRKLHPIFSCFIGSSLFVGQITHLFVASMSIEVYPSGKQPSRSLPPSICEVQHFFDLVAS